jgi:hypothetical protein
VGTGEQNAQKAKDSGESGRPASSQEEGIQTDPMDGRASSGHGKAGTVSTRNPLKHCANKNHYLTYLTCMSTHKQSIFNQFMQ